MTRPSAVKARPKSYTLNALAQRQPSPFTTWWLDPDLDSSQGLPIGQSGSIGLGGMIYAADSAAPNIVAGKYRKGIQPVNSTNGFIWAFPDGIIPTAEFTIEFWLACDSDWTTVTGIPTLFFGESPVGNSIMFQLISSKLNVTLAHTQNPANIAYSVQAQTSTLASGTYLAGVFHHVMFTLTRAGALTIYLDGTQVAQTTSVVAPMVYGNGGQGVKIPAGTSSSTNTHCTISDLFIHRKAFVPGVEVTNPTDENILAIGSGAGHSKQLRLGVCKPFCGDTACPQSAMAAISKNEGGAAGTGPAVPIFRDDKFLSVTPIKSGGTDSTHPTAGVSGSFSYDWQVVDRSLNWLSSQLGAIPYISIDNNPQLLGGSVAPYSNTDFTLSAAAQAPDTLGTITFTSATTSLSASGEFTATVVGGGTNRYSYSSKITNGLGGVTLISGTPGASITGGSTIHVGLLTGAFAYNASSPAGPPNNLTSWQSIVQDFVDHVVNGLGITPDVWGVWNEPDQAGEWTGTVYDYFRTYQATVNGVLAVVPSAKIAGPELSTWTSSGTRTTWIQGLINFCGQIGQATGVSATPVVGGGTFNGTTTRFYKVVACNGNGNAIASSEVSATPASSGSCNIQWTLVSGADHYKIYAATSSGGQSGATSLLTSNVDGAVNSFIDTGAALSTGSVPSSAVSNNLRLSRISYHWYDGVIPDLSHASLQIPVWASAAGISTPSIIIGEYGWNAGLIGFDPGSGKYPWEQPNGGSNSSNPPPVPQTGHVSFHLNAYAGAWLGALWIFAETINQLVAGGDTRWAPIDFMCKYSGKNLSFFDGSSTRQTQYNAHVLWSEIGATVLPVSSSDLDPGIRLLPTKDGSGKVRVFGVSLHYKETKASYPVTIDVSGMTSPPADGTAVSLKLISDQFGNPFDSLGASSTPAVISQNATSQSKARVRVPARAVYEVIIG